MPGKTFTVALKATSVPSTRPILESLCSVTDITGEIKDRGSGQTSSF